MKKNQHQSYSKQLLLPSKFHKLMLIYFLSPRVLISPITTSLEKNSQPEPKQARRSEERRVGKERRTRASPTDKKNSARGTAGRGKTSAARGRRADASTG